MEQGPEQSIHSEKFVKFLYFLLDIMKVLSDLSKSFQREEFCITDLVVNLEASIFQLDALRQERGPKDKEFLKRYNGEIGVFMCGKENNQVLKLTRTSTHLDESFATFISEVIAYINERFSSLHKEPYCYFTVFDPREMPQDPVDMATYGNKEVRSLLDYFQHFLSEEEKLGIIEQWPILRARLARQKMHKPLDVFSNLLMSPPEDCLVLVDLLLTLSPSTAKCERGFSTMNQLKNTTRTMMNQGTLTSLMRVRCSDRNMANFSSTAAIKHWMSAALTERRIV